MMKLLVLSSLLVVAYSHHLAYTEEDLAQWELFKIEYERDYDAEEENMRMMTFMKNLDFIREHNSKYERGEVTFKVGVNKFADWTNEEFRQRMTGFKLPEGYKREGPVFEVDENFEAPQTVDWRKKGAVTPVKDQGHCNSCWAFSATGSLEGQIFLKNKSELVSLSEQNLVDCITNPKTGHKGCEGGYMDTAFDYVRNNTGIDTESSYPYTAKDGLKCKYNAKNKGATCTGHTDIKEGSEKALQQAVAKVGPISVAIDATRYFQLYKGEGVLVDPECSSSKTDLDHGVLVVGYGTAIKGGDYWLVKNSWGKDWGLSGYILMPRNKNNMCGIATLASYPNV